MEAPRTPASRTRSGRTVEDQLAAERAAKARALARAERLEQAGRAKDDFLSELAHELRTPLTAILGWSSLLRTARHPSPALLTQGLEIIELSARAQAQLIDDLSDLSRIAAGKLRLDLQPLDLRTSARNAVEAARPAAADKGVRLVESLASSPCLVRGDRDRLQQVIGNLLTNAIKFTPESGAVHVSVDRDDERVSLTVSDTGIGIAPTVLPYVFDRFRQGDGTLVTDQGGLGLGLAIVRQLVQLHGGTVTAHSDGEGRGASFVMELALAGDARVGAEPRTALAVEPEAGTLTGLRLLLVEDDPASRETIAALLEQQGARVTATASVREAIASLDREPPDVVVSDLRMPGQDGYALIRELRTAPNESLRETPAVAITAYGRGEAGRRAIEAGFELHVPKPVDAGSLAGAIATLARRRQTPDDANRSGSNGASSIGVGSPE